MSPPSATIVNGLTLQFSATARYSNATSLALTTDVQWVSSDPTIARVSQTGLVQGVATGSVSILASYTEGGITQTGSAFVVVTSATFVGVAVSPPNPTIADQTQTQLTALALFDDGSSTDVTSVAVWASSDTTIASVNSADATAGLITARAPGQAIITASWNGRNGTGLLTVTNATLSRIGLTPTNPTLAAGTSLQMTATGVFSDNSVQDLTNQAVWASSAAAATVTNTGVVTGAAVGAATVTATLLGVTGTAEVQVSAATLLAVNVSPATVSLAKGTVVQLHAIASFTDGSTQDVTAFAEWMTSNPYIANVFSGKSQAGLTWALGQGWASISATYGGSSGTAQVQVTAATLTAIYISPAGTSVPKGLSVQFTATGLFSDLSYQDLTGSATWGSSDGTIVSIVGAGAQQGLATALKQGSVNITAIYGGRSASTLLTVTPATITGLNLSPLLPVIAMGSGEQFDAFASWSDNTLTNVTDSATWTSSNQKVAEISNALLSFGFAHSTGIGQTTISVAFGGMTTSTTLTVTAATLVTIEISPSIASIAPETFLQLAATGFYTDGSQQDLTAIVAWASSSPAVAEIVMTPSLKGAPGLLFGVAPGVTAVSATLGAVQSSVPVWVTNAVLDKIEISPQNPVIAKSASVRVQAIGLFSDGTSQDITPLVVWASSSPSVALTSELWNAMAYGSAVGTATINATYLGITGATVASVTPATLSSVLIYPATPVLAAGTNLPLSALAIYSDGSSQDVTAVSFWSTNATSTATVSNEDGSQGLLHGVASGTATVQASYGGQVGSTSVTVTAAILQSLQVTPVLPSIAKGTSLQLSVTGTFSDGSLQDLTQQAIWGATGTAVTVSNASGLAGQIFGAAVGSAEVTAAFGGVSSTVTVTVTPATLVSIGVHPVLAVIAAGTTTRFGAEGTFTDGSTQDLSLAATWDSSNWDVATVANYPLYARGLATGVSPGAANIFAYYGGVLGQARLTVTPATLVSIAVTPNILTLAQGTTSWLSVIGTFTDNSTQDLTYGATWTSSNELVALVSDLPDSKGLVTSVAPGSATITATVGLRTSTAAVTVTNAVLQSISIAPLNPTVVLRETLQLTATGLFTDNTTQDVTSIAVWTSGNESVAIVSNATGSRGLVSAVLVGTTQITAQIGRDKQSVSLTVQP